MAKTLDNENTTQTRANVSDVKVSGNPDLWVLLCKASSAEQGWMKSTKAMVIPGVGCLVQVTTQQGVGRSLWARIRGKSADQISEALTFVPGARIGEGSNGLRKLITA